MSALKPRIWTERTLRDRCEDVGECLIWKQAVNGQGYPQAFIDGKGGVMVRRWVFTHLLGREIPARSVVTSTCGDSRCCAPAHMKAVTYSKRLSMTYAQGRRNAVLESHKRLDRRRELGTVWLTIEKAREIRARSSERVEDLAKEYGVKDRHIRSIWSGTAWREVAGSSVFSWRPA
jgi:hypothetical protein